MRYLKKISSLFLLISCCLYAQAKERAFITAIPKCGTHLVGRLVMLITHQSWMTSMDNLLHLTDKSINEFNAASNTFLGSHAVASSNNIEIVKKYHYKGIFVYRDPRDQVISFAHYILKLSANWPEVSKKPFDDIITELITNVGCTRSLNNESVWNIPELESFGDINSLYQAYFGWIKEPSMYITTFEKIIGPRGGGSQEVQLTEIMNIAHHIGCEITRAQAHNIADELFGGTHTFRNGQIGEWKTYFNAQHKQIFKEVAGRLLIDLGYEKDFNW